MIKIKTRNGQTLADLAIQTKGAIEALIDLAMVNGVSLTNVFTSSRELYIPDATYNKTYQTYVHVHGVSPATGVDETVTVSRIFSEQFTNEFA